MALKNLVYKKRRIGVVDVHGQKHLFIDGEHVPATPPKKKLGYISPHLPYQSFATLQDLGKAVVEYRSMDEKRKKKSVSRSK